MDQDRNRPENFTVEHEQQQLRISWADGHESVFPLDGLRRACPCVHCQGGHENMGRRPDPQIFNEPPTRQWKVLDLQIVGNYAAQIFWDDGHKTGIYRFDYLRDLCPVENPPSP